MNNKFNVKEYQSDKVKVIKYIGGKAVESEIDYMPNKPKFVKGDVIKKLTKKQQRRLNKAKRKGVKKKNTPKTKSFYKSEQWYQLRYQVLRKYEAKCMCCGRSPKEHGIVIHVDHIKPRSKYPKLALSFDNMQLLCAACNYGKSNIDNTDWRPLALPSNDIELIKQSQKMG
jgi:5-methylcytosine-specific restriction endonuclease McrA